MFDPDYTLSEKDYLAFCHANPRLRRQRTAEGEIVIVPPAVFLRTMAQQEPLTTSIGFFSRLGEMLQ